MDKKIYNALLFNKKKTKWNPVISDNMDRTEEHHANEINEAQQNKTCMITLM